MRWILMSTLKVRFKLFQANPIAHSVIFAAFRFLGWRRQTKFTTTNLGVCIWCVNFFIYLLNTTLSKKLWNDVGRYVYLHGLCIVQWCQIKDELAKLVSIPNPVRFLLYIYMIFFYSSASASSYKRRWRLLKMAIKWEEYINVCN